MTLLLVRSFILSLILTAAPITLAQAHEQSASPRQEQAEDDVAPYAEAAKTVNAFHAALAKGDKEAALSLLAEDVQIYEQGWVERSRDEYAAHHLESDMKFSAAVTREQSRRGGALGNELAFVMTEGRSTGQFNNKTIDSITLETMVLRRSGDGWRIAHIHWSSREAKK